MSAKRVVLGGMVIATGTTLLKRVLGDEDQGDAAVPTPSIILAGAIATAVLLAIAGPAPKVASGLAVIAAFSSVSVAGPDFIQTITPGKKGT